MAYKPTTWQSGDVITADKLNNIENGISYIDESIEDIGTEATTLRNDIDTLSEDLQSIIPIAGTPLIADAISDMTDTNKIYVYVGTESGYVSGDWYYYDGNAWTSGGVYNSTALQTDKTLSVVDMAADAKAVGDGITGLKKNRLSENAKASLLNCFSHVAWIDDHGQTYYNELYDALHPTTKLVSISVMFTGEGVPIYPDTPINNLREYLSVTGHYDDGTSSVINDYALIGEFKIGTCPITVTAHGKSELFDVNVLPRPIYDWDFTKSLTDSIQGQTATLHTGEAWEIPGKSAGTTPPTRTSEGLVFNDAQQLVRLIEKETDTTHLLRDKTIQVDVKSFDLDQSVTDTEGLIIVRFVVAGSRGVNAATGETDRITFDSGISYSYQFRGDYSVTNDDVWVAFEHPAWGTCRRVIANNGGSTTDNEVFNKNGDNPSDISGQTVNIYIDNDGYWSMQVGDNYYGKSENPIDHSILGLQIGSGGRIRWGGGFFDAVISGVRIYDGNIL